MNRRSFIGVLGAAAAAIALPARGLFAGRDRTPRVPQIDDPYLRRDGFPFVYTFNDAAGTHEWRDRRNWKWGMMPADGDTIFVNCPDGVCRIPRGVKIDTLNVLAGTVDFAETASGPLTMTHRVITSIA